MRRSTLLPLAAPFALLIACSGTKTGGVDTCSVGADCPSGACSAQGVCLPVDAGGDDAMTSDDAADTGAPTDTATDVPPGDTASSGCTPNGNFVITPAELPLGPGLKATYKVATNVTIDTAGAAQADGTRVWDLTGALSGDKDVLLETSSPSGTWWASSFPTAKYAVPLSSTSDLLGVFSLDASALSLLGIVSPTDTPATSKTIVTYATPVPMTKFNLALGSSWSATSTVSGTYQGLPGYYYTEAYQVKVDAKGQMKTPFGTFPVLRVSTLLTKTLGVLVTLTRTDGWMAECFGTVALAASSAGTVDPGADFTSAAEVRRLAP